jgi:hypothetical protein
VCIKEGSIPSSHPLCQWLLLLKIESPTQSPPLQLELESLSSYPKMLHGTFWATGIVFLSSGYRRESPERLLKFLLSGLYPHILFWLDRVGINVGNFENLPECLYPYKPKLRTPTLMCWYEWDGSLDNRERPVWDKKNHFIRKGKTGKLWAQSFRVGTRMESLAEPPVMKKYRQHWRRHMLWYPLNSTLIV